jgi:N-formylglutamate amidohydrolase
MRTPGFIFDPPYTIVAPVHQTASVVLDSPHSGSYYPPEFLRASRLRASELRRSEDCYVDELFSDAIAAGAPLLKANFPRAYIDLNREPNELDPHLIDGPLPRTANASSVRVVGGLGTIPRIVSEGEEIYRNKISLRDAMLRISELYEPYHAALSSLLATTQRKFGCALLVDCHSMPSSAAGSSPAGQPDIVLGDRHGVSCGTALVDRLESLLRAQGLRVQRNRPYAGGFITESYGRPARGLHAVQIEVNRAIYMNERTLARLDRFATLKRSIGAVLRDLLPEAQGLLSAFGVAAE